MENITPVAFAWGRVTITQLPNKGKQKRHVVSLVGGDSYIVVGHQPALDILKQFAKFRVLIVFYRYREGEKWMMRIKALYAHRPKDHTGEVTKKLLFLVGQLTEAAETRRFPGQKELATYGPVYLK
jgi:hypothetical protein